MQSYLCISSIFYHMESRPILLLFHGALGDQSQMFDLARLLSSRFTVVCPDFPGHGADAGPCVHTMEELAEGINDLLLDYEEEPVYVFGYSMGGYAAALYAARHKNRIRALVTYGTKWLWSDEIANNEISFLDADKITIKVPAYAQKLQKTHTGAGWLDLLDATRHLMLDLGQRHPLYQQHLKSIDIPVLVLRGENDQMVGVDDLECITALSSHFQSGELPGQKHPFDQVDLQILVNKIHESGIFNVH